MPAERFDFPNAKGEKLAQGDLVQPGVSILEIE